MTRERRDERELTRVGGPGGSSPVPGGSQMQPQRWSADDLLRLLLSPPRHPCALQLPPVFLPPAGEHASSRGSSQRAFVQKETRLSDSGAHVPLRHKLLFFLERFSARFAFHSFFSSLPFLSCGFIYLFGYIRLGTKFLPFFCLSYLKH